jgi:hypothetical protein
MVPNLLKLFKDFQKLQGEIKKIQEELIKEEITGSSGAGMVEVTVNGKLEVVDVKIEKRLLEGRDIQMLQDLIVAAVNDALRRAQERVREKFTEIAGGLSLPELGIPDILNQNP